MARNKLFTLFCVVVTLCAVVLLGNKAVAADNAGAWKERCQDKPEKEGAKGEKSCEIFYQLMMQETKQLFLDFAVRKGDGETPASGRVILPLGISLPEGVKLQIDDGEPLTFNVRYCDASGCVAFILLNDKVLDMLRKGNEAAMYFMTINQQQVRVPVSLLGFSKAYKSL